MSEHLDSENMDAHCALQQRPTCLVCKECCLYWPGAQSRGMQESLFVRQILESLLLRVHAASQSACLTIMSPLVCVRLCFVFALPTGHCSFSVTLSRSKSDVEFCCSLSCGFSNVVNSVLLSQGRRVIRASTWQRWTPSQQTLTVAGIPTTPFLFTKTSSTECWVPLPPVVSMHLFFLPHHFGMCVTTINRPSRDLVGLWAQTPAYPRTPQLQKQTARQEKIHGGISPSVTSIFHCIQKKEVDGF